MCRHSDESNNKQRVTSRPDRESKIIELETNLARYCPPDDDPLFEYFDKLITSICSVRTKISGDEYITICENLIEILLLFK